MPVPVVTPVTPVTIESPCVNLCTIDPATDLCQGCARTLAEIAAWSSGTAAWRAAIMAQLPRRRREAGLD